MREKYTNLSSSAYKLLTALTTKSSKKIKLNLAKGWITYSVGYNGNAEPDVPIILVESGPKSHEEISRVVKGKTECIVLWVERNMLILRSSSNYHVIMNSESEYERVIKIAVGAKIAKVTGIRARAAIDDMIERLKSATEEFVNRGVFSTHYMKNRLFDDVYIRSEDLENVHEVINKSTSVILNKLGWKISVTNEGVYEINETVSIVTTNQDNLSIREGGGAACCSKLCRSSNTVEKSMGNSDKRESVEAIYKQNICINNKLF